MEVRVGGLFCPLGKKGYHAAGLLVTDGTRFIWLKRATQPNEHTDGVTSPLYAGYGIIDNFAAEFFGGCLLDAEKPVSLRIERREGTFRMAYKQDDNRWVYIEHRVRGLEDVELPRTVKVGVVAEAWADVFFQSWFDNFKLTPLSDR